MPPKRDTEQTFTFETVAALVASMQQHGVALKYDLMATLDGNRTASSFEHQFRKVKAKAKELNGIEVTPKKGPKKAEAGTGEKSSKKRSRSKTAETEGVNDEEEVSPSKKVKTEEE